MKYHDLYITRNEFGYGFELYRIQPVQEIATFEEAEKLFSQMDQTFVTLMQTTDAADLAGIVLSSTAYTFVKNDQKDRKPIGIYLFLRRRPRPT